MERVADILRRFWFLILLIVIIVLITGAFLAGYRMGPGITLSRVGILTVENLPVGATVYVDEVLKGTADKTGVVRAEYVSGSHNVIVSVTGDYPWNALETTTSGKTTVVNPILIPEQPNVTELSGADKTTAIARIASSTLPTEADPLKLAGGCADVYVTNNQVVATVSETSGCTPPPYLCVGGKCSTTIIFAPVVHLTNVFQYTGRQDALVVAFNNTLYGIALDPRSPRFFAPILTATNPTFGTLANGTIVVDNNDTVYSVNI